MNADTNLYGNQKVDLFCMESDSENVVGLSIRGVNVILTIRSVHWRVLRVAPDSSGFSYSDEMPRALATSDAKDLPVSAKIKPDSRYPIERLSPGQLPTPQGTPRPDRDSKPAPKPKKRVQVKRACANCQKACKKCAEERPCPRCVRYGSEATCIDSERKDRQRGVTYNIRKEADDQQDHNRSRSAPVSPIRSRIRTASCPYPPPTIPSAAAPIAAANYAPVVLPRFDRLAWPDIVRPPAFKPLMMPNAVRTLPMLDVLADVCQKVLADDSPSSKHTHLPY